MAYKNIKNIKEKVEKIATASTEDVSNITPEEIQCLMYELQCHQIELEMQNDELVKTQLELNEVNNRLHLIYHQVPVGILTLDDKGFIRAVNLNFAKMMRTDANKIINQPFARFIVKDDLYSFIRGYNDFFSRPENKTIQLQLVGENAGAFPVLIKGTADDGNDMLTNEIDFKKRKLIVVITDIKEVINN
ncbi:MAG: PAS domain-containing protein [Gammaproteobacteria bacterium]